MKNMLWKDLRDEVKSILELLDLQKKSREVTVGETLSLCRCSDGNYGEKPLEWYEYIITLEDLIDINNYQYSTENEGYYSSMLSDNTLKYKFIKSPFEEYMRNKK